MEHLDRTDAFEIDFTHQSTLRLIAGVGAICATLWSVLAITMLM